VTPYRCWLAADDESTSVEIVGASPMDAAATWAERRPGAWAVVAVKELGSRCDDRVATYEVDSLGFSETVKVTKQEQCDHGFQGSCHRCEYWQHRLANETSEQTLTRVLARLVAAVQSGNGIDVAMCEAEDVMRGDV
jgi:hypothetical protein